MQADVKITPWNQTASSSLSPLIDHLQVLMCDRPLLCLTKEVHAGFCWTNHKLRLISALSPNAGLSFRPEPAILAQLVRHIHCQSSLHQSQLFVGQLFQLAGNACAPGKAYCRLSTADNLGAWRINPGFAMLLIILHRVPAPTYTRADYGLDERESCWGIVQTLYAIGPAYCSK